MTQFVINALDMKYIDSKEVRDFLSGVREDYKSLLIVRKKGFISVMVDNKRYEISGEEEIKKVTEHIKLSEEEHSDFVNGSVAYSGEVIGICKVLHKLEDMSKVNKGDVIIISMTDPNYIPVMEKAAAFVTDFGGILCHAAIVSREMKKPCIIGTKTATKVFKDGDRVLVDANNGIVKKIG